MFTIPHDIKSSLSYTTNNLISHGFLNLNDSLDLCSHLLHQLTTDNGSPLSEPSRRHSHSSENEDTNEGNQTSDIPKKFTRIPTKIQESAVKSDRMCLKLINTLMSTINNDTKTSDMLMNEASESRKQLEDYKNQTKRLAARCDDYLSQVEVAHRENS